MVSQASQAQVARLKFHPLNVSLGRLRQYSWHFLWRRNNVGNLRGMHSNLEVWSWVLNQHASIPLGYWCFIMFQKKIYWTEMFCALSDQLLLLCKSQTFLFSFYLDHRWRNFIKQQKRLLQECEFSMPVLKYCKSIKKINHIFISIRILEQHFC